MKKHLLASVGVLLATLAPAAGAQETKHFDGGFVGFDAGYLSAGNGVDGAVANFFAGYRVQTDSNMVYGIEGTYGGADIDFIDNQWTINGSIGWVLGPEDRDLFSIGGGYVQVKASGFGATVVGDGYTAFAAYEKALGDKWSFRLKATTYEFDTYIGTAGVALRF